MYVNKHGAQKKSEPDPRPHIVVGRYDDENRSALAPKVGEINDQHRVNKLLFLACENVPW
jgi:hypothetical protein